MPDPIRPEDHGVSGIPGEFVSSETWREDAAARYCAALEEAIHQTFERDAAPRICGNCGNDYKAGSVSLEELDEGSYIGTICCCENPRKCDGYACDLSEDECDHHLFVDPDTEIDRLARLIVSGEYRRRATQEDGGENG